MLAVSSHRGARRVELLKTPACSWRPGPEGSKIPEEKWSYSFPSLLCAALLAGASACCKGAAAALRDLEHGQLGVL